MARLLIHVEGETEEAFANEVLSLHFFAIGYEMVGARIIGNARQRDRRGGIRAWNAVRKDIITHLKGDPGCIATMMVDYYGLPQSGQKAWPGRAQAAAAVFNNKALLVQAALHAEISSEMGPTFNPDRFIPFVVMHEFEGLLFSDCDAFARGIGRRDLANSLQAIRNQFATPEEIDDSPVTAPSKRVEALFPEYQKPLHGNIAALEIGLNKIRKACPHFGRWLSKLESLA